MLYRFYHQLMVYFIKELAYVHIYHPVLLVAVLSDLFYGLVCVLQWSVPIGVLVEKSIYSLFHVVLHYLLCYPVA